MGIEIQNRLYGHDMMKAVVKVLMYQMPHLYLVSDEGRNWESDSTLLSGLRWKDGSRYMKSRASALP